MALRTVSGIAAKFISLKSVRWYLSAVISSLPKLMAWTGFGPLARPFSKVYSSMFLGLSSAWIVIFIESFRTSAMITPILLAPIFSLIAAARSEERRVGKECRFWG